MFFSALQDKVALVTGGTAGIGKAIVKAYIEAGARVAFFGTNQERGAEVVQEMRQLFPQAQVEFFAVDVSKFADVETAISQVLIQFGTIDILVNNAGITRDGLLLRMKEEDWDAVINVNLKSLFNTCRAVIRSMMKARKGKIINITSVAGLTGNAGQANYAASKSGVIGFTKSLAKELASRQICANCIAPGYTDTRMTSVLNEAQKEAILKQIPMERIGRPEDIAYCALFLASALSDYMTGQVLTVDGGMVM